MKHAGAKAPEYERSYLAKTKWLASLSSVFLGGGKVSISSNSSSALASQLWKVNVLVYLDQIPGFLCQYISAFIFPL